MKKVTFFLPLLLVALFACTNGDDLVVETKNQISPYYSTTEAINLACKPFDDFYPSKGRKSLKDITIVQDTGTTDTYAHMNWGWYGQNNGYFRYRNVYDTTNATQYDASGNLNSYVLNPLKYFSITL